MCAAATGNDLLNTLVSSILINCTFKCVHACTEVFLGARAYLLQYGAQLGLVIGAGSFSFQPQQQFRFPVGFES